MPFPDIDGFTFADDQATVAAWLDRVAPARPPEVAAAVARLYQRVEQVSTNLYDAVKQIQAFLAATVPGFIPIDLQAGAPQRGWHYPYNKINAKSEAEQGNPSAAAVQPHYPFKGHTEAAASEGEAPTIDTGGFSYGPDNPSGGTSTIDTGGFTYGSLAPTEERKT